jgi:ABC-type multidrug transport system fused ATPase/permease subunit
LSDFAARQSCYSPPHVAVIDVHSFAFTYPGAQRPAVRHVTFSVEPGEIFGFLGPSGAGKSTTQNVLIRLLDGYEGNVAVLGKDLRGRKTIYESPEGSAQLRAAPIVGRRAGGLHFSFAF